MLMKAIIFTFAITMIISPVLMAETGQAVIQGTTEGSAISGAATFTETNTGLDISVEVAHAAPGRHAFHIHQFGGCSDAGNAAGTHYNPKGLPHGNVVAAGVSAVHAGDFGNLEAGPDGTGSVQISVPGLRLSGGEYNVAGRSIIVHETEDDFGQPTGNAGARVGCGIIVIMQ